MYHITAEDAGDTAEDAAIAGGDRSAMLLLVDDDDDVFVEAEPKQTIFFSLWKRICESEWEYKVAGC